MKVLSGDQHGSLLADGQRPAQASVSEIFSQVKYYQNMLLYVYYVYMWFVYILYTLYSVYSFLFFDSLYYSYIISFEFYLIKSQNN